MVRIGQYLPGKSLVHELDPRTKIAAALLLGIVVLRGEFISCAILSSLIFFTIRVGKIPAGALFSALKPAMIFLGLLFFLHLFFTKGTPVPPFKDWVITITFEGFQNGALVAWQFGILLAGGALLTMTTQPSRLVEGLEWFLRPLNVVGIRSHEIALMVSLALRLVPTLLEEMHKVREAQVSRGAVFGKGGPIRRIRATVSLVMPVLLGCFRRADDLTLAMEARGYAGARRTSIRELQITRKDWLAAGVIVIVMVIVISSDRIIGII
jgi:biotin transport system permease protein/energy-coupling factor transport system permease protein